MGNPFEISSIDNSELHAGRRPIEEHRLTSQLRKPPRRVLNVEPLLTAEDVAKRLNVSTDWVWDHSSRRLPYLPVIRMSDGALRYRSSEIEEFLNERARAAQLHRRRR